MNVPPLIVRARPWYLRGKVMLTVTDEGLESPAFRLIFWDAIRSLPAVDGTYRRRLEIDVYDKASYISRLKSPSLACASHSPLRSVAVGLTDQVVEMSPEQLRAEIELRAGRTFPH